MAAIYSAADIQVIWSSLSQIGRIAKSVFPIRLPISTEVIVNLLVAKKTIFG